PGHGEEGGTGLHRATPRISIPLREPCGVSEPPSTKPDNGSSQAASRRASKNHVRPFHDHAPKHTAPSAIAPSPNAITLGGLVAKMKIHPSSATRLGNG